MKKIIFAFLIFCFQLSIITDANAAPVRNMPVKRLQPNGDTLNCFISGDEYYHRLHDANGYTIVQSPSTGWYVYADRQWDDSHSDWEVVATNHIVGTVEPSTLGIDNNIVASPSTVAAKYKKWEIPTQYLPNALANGNSSSSKAISSRNRGIINNVVIFIRFSDDDEIATPYSTIESMFNDSSANSISMHNYFWRASYSQLRIKTYFFPEANGDSIISYQDTEPRSYYMPYNATTNPNGYQDDNSRRMREFDLLQRAVHYVTNNNLIPSDLNLDMDNDDMVDNICFVVKGTYTGWSELLWPHKWSLFDREVYINGKRVYTFNLQLEGSGSHYFSTSTFCHEMFHTLGAPDLYHYENYTDISSVGSWDLMCNNTTPPQHMGMYMKMQYGKWIDTIPEITEAGTYTLNSVGDSIHTLNQCYRIQSADPAQWYMLEYRDNTELFETGLGGSGLLIYRIDSRYGGCANFDGVNYFDEVYIFRPGGSDQFTGGHISQAFFSANAGRTSFSANTDPYPWLTGNVIDTTIEISNISQAGSAISFTYTPHRPVVSDCGDTGCTVTVEMTDYMGDTWNGAYLSFETQDGQQLAATSMGDGTVRETKSLRFCRQPIVVRWYGGVAHSECGFKITLADSSVWKNIGHATESTIIGTINDPCERYIPPQYTITVQSCDTINHVSGGGTFNEGTTISILAQEMDNYTFVGWHDGPYNGPEDDDDITSYEQRRSITVTGDSLITAIFAPLQYSVRVITASGQEEYGTVTGSSSVPYGASITISATAAEGYVFDYWRKNYNSEHITDNPFTDIVTGDVTYRAFFHPINAGIEEGADCVKVYSNAGQIIVEGAQGRHIDVLNTLGQIVLSSTCDRQQSSFNFKNAPGLYIVRIQGQLPQKVIINH